ncbi:putative ABC transport system permease protein [Parabacteroides sp. PF5-5]|uniref:ABC transporter permease n=1 Tax=unclassified Parabacteroides TaxID=2649774 RepID=UPI002473E42C|nr:MULTISPECIES: ABC transporter permease [unclassified Parabacteroides]MDH6305281.1 putative ABC transport system permease protein [Parabacteroides sp. PH5-39]MDH6316634.1 putative ABC transport system permease protein [Parabacteroides sp. PF5-13]MDH6320186.1 putative ABC transport system permease protein [Parabacteroides sp. PH5-13]MDH6323871.1 putative ABC transport system permease protein [Parabacteroides sp. PH5-8]MDH6327863.1 putative ABC transport system permease protein [Parabacteroide
MFNQIIKIIWNQRTSNAWIWAEMLLVSICLWYIVDDLYLRAKLYLSPMGYDISDVYVVDLHLLTNENEQYRPQSEYGTTLGEDLLTVVSRMRTYPGVEVVGISESSLSYSYSRNYSNMQRINLETEDTLNCGRLRRFNGTPDYIRVFRYATEEGNTDALADNLSFNQQIITSDAAATLFPEGNATGKFLSYANDSLAIYVGGVMSPIRFGDFDTYTPTFIRSLSENAIATELNELYFGRIDVTLRANPSTGKDFATNFLKEMREQLRYHNIYLLNIRSYDDIRTRYIRTDINEAKMYLAGVFFLLINIFLGVVGTFFFRTQHRLGEMGLRIALGSTTRNLRSILIGEGLVILLFAFVPAACIALNLGLKEIVDVEVMPFTIGRFILCQGITFILMTLMISTGIWFPSRKVVNLQPAESLRYE